MHTDKTSTRFFINIIAGKQKNFQIRIAKTTINNDIVFFTLYTPYRSMKYALNVWCKMRVLRKIKSETSLTMEDNNHINRSHLYNRSQSFHEDIRFALVLSQCFGVMPLHNVGKNVEDVQFKFLSLRFLYSVIHFGCVFATGVAAVVKMALHGFLIDETCKYYA